MTLAVIGDRRAVAVAGLASLCSGQTVLLSRGPGRSRGAGRLEGPYSGTIEVAVIDRPTADIYVAVTTGAGLDTLLADHRELLAGRVLLVAPGGFGAVVRVRQLFRRWGVEPPVVAEAPGCPAIGEGDGTIMVRGIARELPVAGIDRFATDQVLAAVGSHLPDLVAGDLATTSLSDPDHVLHPMITLLNADRIGRGEEFAFYRDGPRPELDDQVAALDAERLELVRRLGGEPLSITDRLLRSYADQGMAGSTITECLAGFPGFATEPAPLSLWHRYLLDDVPYGLAGQLAVADELGVDAPRLRSLITTAEHRIGQPLRAEPPIVHAFLDAVSARPASAGCARALT